MMTRLAVLFLAAGTTALSGQAKPDTIIVRRDSLVLKQLAAEKGIDTSRAQLKIRGDTAWVWFRRDPSYSVGAEFRRLQGRWEPYSSSDTTSAAPGVPPGLRRPRPATQTAHVLGYPGGPTAFRGDSVWRRCLPRGAASTNTDPG